MSGGQLTRAARAAHAGRRRAARRRAALAEPRGVAHARARAEGRDAERPPPTPPACSRARSPTRTRSCSSRTRRSTSAARRSPTAPAPVPIGARATLRAGGDVTIVAPSRMVARGARRGRARSPASGIEAEVIDPRTLVPLDLDAIVASVGATRPARRRPRGGRARRLRRRDRGRRSQRRAFDDSTRRSSASARRSRRSRSARRSRTPTCRIAATSRPRFVRRSGRDERRNRRRAPDRRVPGSPRHHRCALAAALRARREHHRLGAVLDRPGAAGRSSCGWSSCSTGCPGGCRRARGQRPRGTSRSGSRWSGGSRRGRRGARRRPRLAPRPLRARPDLAFAAAASSAARSRSSSRTTPTWRRRCAPSALPFHHVPVGDGGMAEAEQRMLAAPAGRASSSSCSRATCTSSRPASSRSSASRRSTSTIRSCRRSSAPTPTAGRSSGASRSSARPPTTSPRSSTRGRSSSRTSQRVSHRHGLAELEAHRPRHRAVGARAGRTVAPRGPRDRPRQPDVVF